MKGGAAIQEKYKDTACIVRNSVSNAYLEFKLARAIKGRKKSFCMYTASKRLRRALSHCSVMQQT